MRDDHELLLLHAKDPTGEAFGELVRRHLDLVYAAALRQTDGNTHLARDVAQSVFADLARKAGSIDRRVVLVGWLHTAVRFAASKAKREATRRTRRERAAAEMNEATDTSEAPLDPARLQPVLDAAIGELKPRERDAVLMRFFERRDFADLGARLAMSESAARSCVDRALLKMRAGLARRGVSSSALALAAALSGQAAVVTPAGLAAAVSAQAAAAAVLPAPLLFATMTKLHYTLVGLLLVGGGLGTALTLRLADRERELALLRPQALLAEALHRENSALRQRTAAPAVPTSPVPPPPNAAAAPAPSPLTTTGTPETQLVDLDQFRNVGAATPAAAFQTMVWGSLKGDSDTLASLMILDPGGDDLDALHRQLPAELRQAYPSPAHLAGLMWSSRMVEFAGQAQILGTETKDETHAVLSIKTVSPTDREPRIAQLRLERVGDRWGFPTAKTQVEHWLKEPRKAPAETR